MVFPHSRPLQRRRRKTRVHDFQQFPILGSLDDKIVLFAPHGPSYYWRLCGWRALAEAGSGTYGSTTSSLPGLVACAILHRFVDEFSRNVIA